MKRLAELGKLAKDEPIDCRVITREEALATSIAENSGREPMSAADTVEAFAELVKTGSGIEEIAVCFGITPLTVRRRLKLANVSPKLFALFRAGDIELEQMMALAISDDHDRQEAVWEGTHHYERAPQNLRRLLLNEAVQIGRDPVALFVGIEAYEAAGGVVTRDLFDEDAGSGYMADGQLLYRLAKDKLDAEASKVKAEGWAWVEARPSFDYSERHRFGTAPMGLREATAKEKAKLEALEKAQQEADAALEAIYESGDEDQVDEDQAERLERAADDARRAIDKVHAKMRRYTPDVLAVAGAVVTIEHDGEFVVHRGLIKPEDRKAVAKVVQASSGSAGKGSGDGSSDGSGDDDKPSLAESVLRKLTAHRTRALQVRLAQNTHVALASVVHALVQQLVYEHCYHPQSALDIRAKDCEHALRMSADDMKGSTADAAIGAMLAQWRERIPSDAEQLLPWLVQQEEATLLELLALCVACSANMVSAKEGAHAGDAIAQALRLDVADFWQATGTSYFAQVPKAKIVEAVSEAVSPTEGQALAKLKKGEAVARAEALVAGKRWLPAVLRAVV